MKFLRRVRKAFVPRSALKAAQQGIGRQIAVTYGLQRLNTFYERNSQFSLLHSCNSFVVALKLLLDSEVDLRQLSRFSRANWACEDDGTTGSFKLRRVRGLPRGSSPEAKIAPKRLAGISGKLICSWQIQFLLRQPATDQQQSDQPAGIISWDTTNPSQDRSAHRLKTVRIRWLVSWHRAGT